MSKRDPQDYRDETQDTSSQRNANKRHRVGQFKLRKQRNAARASRKLETEATQRAEAAGLFLKVNATTGKLETPSKAHNS
jgi:hypothetical protein